MLAKVQSCSTTADVTSFLEKWKRMWCTYAAAAAESCRAKVLKQGEDSSREALGALPYMPHTSRGTERPNYEARGQTNLALPPARLSSKAHY